MKSKLIIIAGAVLLAAVSVLLTASKEKEVVDKIFNANVEALSEDEIIVGDLCMVHKDRICFSLNEPYPDHIRP